MRKIANENLAQLLMQVRFTPPQKRRKQLEAAERLLAIINKDKEYPFEFVCFRITGFHPKSAEQQLLKGANLADDLRVFIAKLGGKLAAPASLQREKIYTVVELAAKLNVSRKTIDRWRSKGLLSRRYVFEDGIRRLGFLQSTVDKFQHENAGIVAKATAFRRLAKGEKRRIVETARALARRTRLSRYQIIGQVAARIGASRETVRSTILEYEKNHADRPVFSGRCGSVGPSQAGELYRLHTQGATIAELMSRFGRARSSIHRIINQRRAMALLARRVEYVPSSEFLEPTAREKILAKPFNVAGPHLPQSAEGGFDLAGEHLLPEYLEVLRAAPVLGREEEMDLFRRYNYLKYLAAQDRIGIKLSRVSGRLLTKVGDYLAEAEEIRSRLVEAHLRLVVSIASKHTTMGTSFQELVSKGNFALIEAVEQHDYTKGLRFARRAAMAIAKEYAKVSGKDTELSRKRAVSVATIQRDLKDKAADVLAIERTRQSLAQVIKEELDDREQYVILNHFGLVGSPIRKRTKTLQQIGEDLALSKERVRQIELVALQKLRQSLSPEQFELLTG